MPVSSQELEAGCRWGDTAGTCLVFDLLTDAGVRTTTREIDRLNTLRMRKRTSRWRNATAISWAPAGSRPKRLQLVDNAGDRWGFLVDDRVLELDLAGKGARWIE